MGYDIWEGAKVRLRAQDPRDDYIDYDSESDRMCDVVHFPPAKAPEPTNDAFTWIIETKDENVVGSICTHGVNKRMGIFKYGIGIKREHWGNGYAKEAIYLVLRYYFQELRYQKVTVSIYSFNQRSIALHEKLGFKQEGRLRRMIYTNGQYFDEILVGMTDDEFNAINDNV